MRFLYLTVSLLPTLAVLTLAWFVVRAISVRVVWRETESRRTGRGEPARELRTLVDESKAA
jgi:hypothetical protein